MHWTKEKKSILCHNLFGDKIIQNCLKIDATHQYESDLLLRQETKKKNCLSWKDASGSKDVFFTGHVPSDCHCACLSNKSKLYQWVASILRHPMCMYIYIYI